MEQDNGWENVASFHLCAEGEPIYKREQFLIELFLGGSDPNKDKVLCRLKPLLRYRITEEKHNQDMLQKP